MVFLLRSYEAARTGVTSVRGDLIKLHEASVGVNDFLAQLPRAADLLLKGHCTVCSLLA